jgi:hypothetical protein
MASGSQLRIEALRTLAFGAIGAAYANVGTPLVNPAQILILQNTTDATLMFSFDGGITDHIALMAYSSIIIDVSSDLVMSAGALYISVGTQIAVKQRAGAASLGSADITTIYSR